jgi:Peptidase A4 family
MKNLLPALTIMLVLAAPLTSKAQSQNPNEIPTNLAGTTTITAPPEGFDPLTASDDRLADYGFPPRPDKTSMPTEYANWARAMAASKTRLIPQLEQTNIFHGPAVLTSESNSEQKGPLQSYNWSGYVDSSGAKSYGSSSFYYAESNMIVPFAQPAYGTCTGIYDYAYSWVGIDGWSGSNDILQGGIEFDALCSLGVQVTYYSAFYEWYPGGEVHITNFPIAPGDDIFVDAWHTSSTKAQVYISNYNTGMAVQVGFSAPAGTKLIGNSAEWITERPNLNGQRTTLTNYLDQLFYGSEAVTEKKHTSYPGSSSSKQVIMLDNNGKPISAPTALGNSAFLLQDEGSAY